MEITNLADAKLEFITQMESIRSLNLKVAELERWQWHRRFWLLIKSGLVWLKGKF